MSNRVRVIDRETGAESYVLAGEYDPTRQELAAGQVQTVDPLGEGGEYAAGQAVTERALAGGLMEGVSPEERARLTRERVTEEQFGGTLGAKLEQLGRGALAELTAGGSELLAREADPFERERQARKREAESEYFTGGQVVGGVAGALAPVGVAGIAGRAARGRLGRIGESVVEGAVSGAGAGVADLAIQEDPITLERAASTISSNALFGAGVGGATSALGHAAERGLLRARKIADEMKAGGGVPLESNASALRAYRTQTDEVNPWLVVEGEDRAVLTKAKKRIRRLLDEPIGLEESPWRALDPLRREAAALRRTIDQSEELAARLAKEDTSMASKILEDLGDASDVKIKGKAATRYGAFSGTKASARKGVTVPRDEALRFQAALASGEVAGARKTALDQLGGVLEQNEALQASIVAAREAGKESALEKQAKTYALGAATGVLPGGPIGMMLAAPIGRAADKIADLVKGRLARTTGESAARSGKAVNAFLQAGKVGARVAPVAATKVLRSVAYGPSEPDPHPTGDELVDSFRAREREIRRQVVTAPDGTSQVTPVAREAIAARLAGAFMASPMIGDQMEAAAVRRLGFLASKLPRRPDFGTIPIGPDRWRPSAMELAKFARYVAAVESPDTIEERLVDGSLTPEDAEVLREVYPERFAELQRELVERLPELQETLPYERRLSLSILFGVPVDPTMTPSVVATLQASFADEPGTEGGVQAPRAVPQFGSVTRPEPTPGQERATG
jgi:hypothetical protein